MTRRVAALLLAVGLSACATDVVELAGKLDAAPADAGIDANLCRCRVSGCRSSDCTATGGTCQPDGFCTGDFGACRVDSECAAAIGGVCTSASDSTAPCR